VLQRVRSATYLAEVNEKMARRSRKEELKAVSSPCAIARSPREFYSLGAHAPAIKTYTGSSPNESPYPGAKRTRRRKASPGLRRRSRVNKCVCGDIKVPLRRTKVTIKYEPCYFYFLISTIKTNHLATKKKGLDLIQIYKPN